MKRIVFGFLAIGCVALGVAGCKNNNGGNMGLPDGFVSSTCNTVDDCAPTACQTAKCNPVTHMCQYTEKTCDSENECTKGVCDEASGGMCVQQPDNEGMGCTTMEGDPGSCVSGSCTPVPTCAPALGFIESVFCDTADYSVIQGNNGPMAFGGGMPVINSYGCAPSESGPEVAYTLSHDDTAGDEDITIMLTPVNMDGTPASADDKDLDLIILEDTCTAAAKCMNPMITGGAGYQGVTAGTAKERVTFRATAGKTYYVVVDGKDANQVRDYKIEIEACGKCQPTDGTRISCNMTMPVNGDTAQGAAQLIDYTCGTAMTAVSAPGKEIPFYFRTDNNAVRNVTANLTGATGDYRMQVLPTSFWGQCDPTACLDTKSGPAATNSLTWKVDPGSNSFARYWVLVDTPTTSDITFGVQLSCARYCKSEYSLACNGASDTTTVTGTTTPPTGDAQSSSYGPGTGCNSLMGLSGPEVAVAFAPDIVGTKTYQLELQAKTATKDLYMQMMDAGTGMEPACDPTATCMTLTANNPGGATGTLKTDIGNNKTAAATFTATSGHTYYIMIDGTDASGGDFKLNIAGTQTGAHCGI